MRKIGVFLCLFVIVPILKSCTPVSIADNRRIQVKGTVMSNPDEIQDNVTVGTYTYVGGHVLFSYPNLKQINSTITNNDGSFSLTSLDVNPGKFVVSINREQRNDLQSLAYHDSESVRQNALIDLGNIILKKRIDFQIMVNIAEDIPYTVSYANQDPVILINNWKEMQELEDEYINSKIIEREGSLTANENGVRALNVHTLEETEIILTLYYEGEERIFNISADSQNTPYEVNL